MSMAKGFTLGSAWGGLGAAFVLGMLGRVWASLLFAGIAALATYVYRAVWS